jgi:hypothetical protein
MAVRHRAKCLGRMGASVLALMLLPLPPCRPLTGYAALANDSAADALLAAATSSAADTRAAAGRVVTTEPPVDRLLREYLVWHDHGYIESTGQMATAFGDIAQPCDLEMMLQPKGGGEERWFRVKSTADGRLSITPLGPVEVRDAGRGVAFVRWRQCVRGTADQILRELAARKGLSGVVVDVRGNAGGHLIEAVQLAEAWAQPRTELLRLYRSPLDRQAEKALIRFTTRLERRWEHPLVCVTDGRTASTAEAFVGIVKALGVGTSVGQCTMGDGIAYTRLEPATVVGRGGRPAATTRAATRNPPATPLLIEVRSLPLYHNRGIEPDQWIAQPAARPATPPPASFEEACRKAAIDQAVSRVNASAPHLDGRRNHGR